MQTESNAKEVHTMERNFIMSADIDVARIYDWESWFLDWQC